MLHRDARRLAFLPATLFAALVVVLPAPTAAQSGGTVLTLRDCVNIALDSSASVRIRQAEVEIAEQDVKAGWGAFLPDLVLSGSYNRSDRTDFDSETAEYGLVDVGFETVGGDSVYIPYQVQTGSITEDVNIRSTGKSLAAAANLRLFDGLANVNRLKSAKKYREAAYLNEDYSREQVIQNVAVAYYDLLRYIKLEEVAVETRDEAAAQLERTETYFRLGSAAKSEVLQQRVRLEQTRFDLVVAQNRVEESVANLAYAMNRPLAQRVDVDISPLQTEMVLEDVNVLYEEALVNRLDLKGTQYVAEASGYDASAAGGAFWPTIDLFGRYSRNFDDTPYRFGSQQSQSLTLGGQASWAVFNRFQNWTNSSQAKARARIAEYNHEQAGLDAQLEVRQFHNLMHEATERHKVAGETISQSEEELRLAQERFRVGAGTQLDRITAEANLASARAEEVQAVCDYLIARARLWRAVGRFNQLGRETP